MTSQTQHLEPNTTQTITVAKPSLEHQREPLGIGQAAPRLSWIVQTDLQNWLQSAYEIEVSRAGTITTSGRIGVTDSVLQPWPFAPLQSREHLRLRVRVWGQDGSSSDWSEALEAEAGLFNAAIGRHILLVTPGLKMSVSSSRVLTCAVNSSCANPSRKPACI